MICSRLSEDSNSLLFAVGSDVFGQGIAGAIANFSIPNGVPNDLICSDEMTEAAKVLGARIDENINVRACLCLVTCIGAEQVWRRHPCARNWGSTALSFVMGSLGSIGNSTATN